MSLKDADQLDWIKPEPTCSKEFADALKEKVNKAAYMDTIETVYTWLDCHIDEKK